MCNNNGEVRYDLSEISAELDIMKASKFLLGLGSMYFAYFLCQNRILTLKYALYYRMKCLFLYL